MRIVIDMQGAQSPGSRNRGIGRYSLAFAHGIIRNKGRHEVILVLNGCLQEGLQQLQDEFGRLLSKEQIRVWYPPGQTAHINAGNAWVRRASECLFETFIASLEPDVFLITSLFEGLSDDAITAVGTEVPTAVILYDLIPLINSELYLANPVTAQWYQDKLAYLRAAHLQLAISSSSRLESIERLGTPVEQVVTISTAADPLFRPTAIDANAEQVLRSRYGLNRPFVMYTGGIDHRKNIEGLIRAYGALSKDLRAEHQLAIVCAVQPADRQRLEALATRCGLTDSDLVLTGFVPEEDLLGLYNLCKVFVFPSWHEGFGLPALEAMACGRATIGANSSSLPEVIGLDEALFDPHDPNAISQKLEQVLVDADFRKRLEEHGLKQARRFSWDHSAKLAIEALERYSKLVPSVKESSLPRLAYVSPLPPERTGIADYSAELLPVLAKYYEIDVIVNQVDISDAWINGNCRQRSVEWFRENSARYDRILYHFGNSSFHEHMFDLLRDFPGTVVLHDFYLSGVLAHAEATGTMPNAWVQALYESHGYVAVQHRFKSNRAGETIWVYPCNLSVLQQAQGIIVHSRFSSDLAKKWYAISDSVFKYIPHLRNSAPLEFSKVELRSKLGFQSNDFIVCSFGLIGQTKLNHRLLSAWLQSPLASDGNCYLVFVGENDGGPYGASLIKSIPSDKTDKIKITGWADATLFKDYLHAADIGVQLRTKSRGETSGTILDCMSHGLATIVNANGGMAELPLDSVWMLDDEFDDQSLVQALTTLYSDESKRRQLGAAAKEIITQRHDPERCAMAYQRAIEQFHHTFKHSVRGLVDQINDFDGSAPSAAQIMNVAAAIDRTLVPPVIQGQILFDATGFVGKSHLPENIKQWLADPPHGYRVEPIYQAADSISGYRYARKLTLATLGCPEHVLEDEPVTFRAGDGILPSDANRSHWPLPGKMIGCRGPE